MLQEMARNCDQLNYVNTHDKVKAAQSRGMDAMENDQIHPTQQGTIQMAFAMRDAVGIRRSSPYSNKPFQSTQHHTEQSQSQQTAQRHRPEQTQHAIDTTRRPVQQPLGQQGLSHYPGQSHSQDKVQQQEQAPYSADHTQRPIQQSLGHQGVSHYPGQSHSQDQNTVQQPEQAPYSVDPTQRLVQQSLDHQGVSHYPGQSRTQPEQAQYAVDPAQRPAQHISNQITPEQRQWTHPQPVAYHNQTMPQYMPMGYPQIQGYTSNIPNYNNCSMYLQNQMVPTHQYAPWNMQGLVM